MHRSQLSLYWLEQIRRETARFVHFLGVIPNEARNLAQGDRITLRPKHWQSSIGGILRSAQDHHTHDGRSDF